MAFFLVSCALAVYCYYLLYTLNEVNKNVYTWQRNVEFEDYINSRKISVKFSSEDLLSSSIKRDISSDFINEFEEYCTCNNSFLIPNKMAYLSFLENFYKENNLIGSLHSIREEDIPIFKDKQTLTIPSAIVNGEIYNIHILYDVIDLDSNLPIPINTIQDYFQTLNNVYLNNKNYLYRVTYMNYKKHQRKDNADLVSLMRLETRIGSDFKNINYGKPYIINAIPLARE